jgi:WD40 repeat protein
VGPALLPPPTTGHLFSASRDGTVRLWEIGAAHELAELTREATGVEGLRVTADGATLIVGTEDGRILRVALNQLDRYVERNASAWPR